MNDKNNVLVAIWMVTYNHENFIAQAINSVMKQQTDFAYRLFIGEDCSKDKTKDICKKYKEKFPDKIKLFLNKSNLGPNENSYQIYKACYESGAKYIAMLEGDDYWTDALKLQKQVDFLEENKDVNLVHTDFDWLMNDSEKRINNFYRKENIFYPKKYDINYLFMNPKLRTLTFCYRSKYLDKTFFEIIGKWTVGDTVLAFYLIKNKKFGFINESTGVYRRNSGSVSVLNKTEKQFHYWKNGPIAVKYFFYDYYNINDKKIKNKLDEDYYEGMLKHGLLAKRYKYVFLAINYKIWKMKLSTYNLKLILLHLLNKIRQSKLLVN